MLTLSAAFINAATGLEAKNSFHLCRINLVRAGCPRELQASQQNVSNALPIVVLKNRHNLGYISSTGYYPSGVIAAGAARRTAMLQNGIIRSYAWVEEEAMTINADDAMSCNELMDKLSRALQQKYRDGSSFTPNTVGPWIVEIYVFENYMIFSYNGDKYRQAYTLDPTAKTVVLVGTAQKVEEKFVNACGVESMPRVDTGVRYAFAPSRSKGQTSNTGAESSELITQIIRNMADIQDSVSRYLMAIKTGAYIQPKFSPVPLVGNKIATSLAALGVAPYFFAKWSLDHRTKGGSAVKPTLTDSSAKKAWKELEGVGNPKACNCR